MTQEDTLIVAFFAPVNATTVSKLLSVFDNVNGAASTAHLLINTGGGSTDQGILAHNYLRSLPTQITTVNMGKVHSIGTPIYCAGDERLAVPNANFGFHPNVFNIKNESLGARKLREKASQLELEHDAIASIVSDRSDLSLDDVKAMITEHKVLSVEDASKSGLVHRIQPYEATGNILRITG